MKLNVESFTSDMDLSADKKIRSFYSYKLVLIAFDINKTILYAHKKTKLLNLNLEKNLENVKSNEHIEGYDIYYRNGRPELLDFLFVENAQLFDIGVWSSLDKDYTGHFAKSYFGRYYRNLQFVIACKRETYEGVLRQTSVEPLQIHRDFKQLQEKFQDQYTNNNIIMISNYPNLTDSYTPNDIILSKYDPIQIGNIFGNDLEITTLIKYLRGLKVFVTVKNVEDVRPVIQAKSFKQTYNRILNNQRNYNEIN
ncbi:hypothetical protein IMG5_177980 [Ichthyophthirius multifiliis]|uniref:FCP1 homology domain-containing protein n=1 Tax=Ichthyophthirius multifiliis TaxID=5932 RepID=G0R2H0_ICHMU|nr:hypothetical protein IMG5_177980 [Ichthyophthirius multifiliis]EGR28338.1 hypothetical protein IMG5_177980 [Ichthyophthirius multifiliis]|eukprot:XP_004027683.1 hypothetical protein IMG5_177980 [Ichthyophthirius multifiliis]